MDHPAGATCPQPVSTKCRRLSDFHPPELSDVHPPLTACSGFGVVARAFRVANWVQERLDRAYSLSDSFPRPEASAGHLCSLRRALSGLLESANRVHVRRRCAISPLTLAFPASAGWPAWQYGLSPISLGVRS